MQKPRHGFIVAIGPANNPNYFTGAGYSVFLDDAKVFRTERGASCAARIWQQADYNPSPLPAKWYGERRVEEVGLILV